MGKVEKVWVIASEPYDVLFLMRDLRVLGLAPTMVRNKEEARYAIESGSAAREGYGAIFIEAALAGSLDLLHTIRGSEGLNGMGLFVIVGSEEEREILGNYGTGAGVLAKPLNSKMIAAAFELQGYEVRAGGMGYEVYSGSKGGVCKKSGNS